MNRTVINPIVAKKKELGVTWQKLSSMTGIYIQQLQAMRLLSPREVKEIRLKTIAKLQDTVGIDLIAYYKLSLPTKALAKKE